jgi:AcrR family transcriptional regulator
MAKPKKEAATRLTTEEAVERLVDAAIKLLAEKGPSEIKVRSVAEAAQVSTVAVYYHLGGLPELMQAVVDKGFRELGRVFDAIPVSDDPVSDLFTMAVETRRLAQSNPHLYDLMFALSTRGTYRPLDSTGAGGQSEAYQAAYTRLIQACARLVRSGRIRADADPEIVATQLWSCVHGFVTLEMGGYFAHLQDPVRQTLQSMLVNVFVGLGDSAERADASHTSVLAAFAL